MAFFQDTLFIIIFTLLVISNNATTTYHPREFTDGGVCQRDLDKVLRETYLVLHDKIEQHITQNTAFTTEEHKTAPNTPSVTTDQVPCGSPGWRLLTFVNMRDMNYVCPPGLIQLTRNSKRACDGALNVNLNGCTGTIFSVSDEYSSVCGWIIGYTRPGTSYAAFYNYNIRDEETIEGPYVHGVSLTHGSIGQRQHIWTFVGGLADIQDQRYSFTTNQYCQCAHAVPSAPNSPPFVGNDYFCESGNNMGGPVISHDDALWDGQTCPSGSTCCQFNNPPWFTKVLPSPTTDPIELRICGRNMLIVLIELYIK